MFSVGRKILKLTLKAVNWAGFAGSLASVDSVLACVA